MQPLLRAIRGVVVLRGVGSLAAVACVLALGTAERPATSGVALRDSLALHRSAIATIDAYEDLAEAHYISPTSGPCEFGPNGCEGIRCVAVPGHAPCFMGRRMPCFPGAAWPDFTQCQQTPASLAGDSARLVRARRALLAKLDSIGKEIPGDQWVSGQRVHYLVASGDPTTAVRVADACLPGQTGRAWCLELQAFAHARNGESTVAEALFDTLFAGNPDARCRLGDPSRLFDESNMQHDAPSCKSPQLALLENRLWWLSDPSWLVPGNDRRVEHFARKVDVDLTHQWIVDKCAFAPRFLDRLFHNKICFESAATLGRADSVHVVREGVADSWYAHVDFGVPPDTSHTGHDPRPPPTPAQMQPGTSRRRTPPPATQPSLNPLTPALRSVPEYCPTIWPLATESRFHFVPERGTIDAPLSARASDWDLTAGRYGFPAPQTLRYCDDEHWRFRPERYTPPYAGSVTQLREWQVAYFRRGNAAQLVGAADLSHDTLFARLLASPSADSIRWTAGAFAFANVQPSGSSKGFGLRVESSRPRVRVGLLRSRPRGTRCSLVSKFSSLRA